MVESDLELLPELDRDFLEDKGFTYRVVPEGGVLNILIENFAMPAAYVPRTCTLLLRLPAGYPNANPDMFWTSPTIHRVNGSKPTAAEVTENYVGQSWQRWSRHFASWRQGVDGLRTYIVAVRKELDKGL